MWYLSIVARSQDRVTTNSIHNCSVAMLIFDTSDRCNKTLPDEDILYQSKALATSLSSKKQLLE